VSARIELEQHQILATARMNLSLSKKNTARMAMAFRGNAGESAQP
jgi:hypothetical protein